MPQAIKYLKNDFAEFFLFENFIIAQIKEGAYLTPDNNDLLVDIVDRYYNHRKVVYITNRVNDYEVSPTIYIETSKIENVVGICIVNKYIDKKLSAKVESLFYEKAFNVCDNIEDAITWANLIVNEYLIDD